MNPKHHNILAATAWSAVAILCIVTTIMLHGCNTQKARQYAVDAAAVTVAMLEIEAQEGTVVDLLEDGGPNFTEDEKATLREAKAEIYKIRDYVRELAVLNGNVGRVLILMNPDEIARIYSQAKAAYVKARTVVAPHISEYSRAGQITLMQFDRAADKLDRSMTQLMDAANQSDATQMIKDALAIGAAVARVAL